MLHFSQVTPWFHIVLKVVAFACVFELTAGFYKTARNHVYEQAWHGYAAFALLVFLSYACLYSQVIPW